MSLTLPPAWGAGRTIMNDLGYDAARAWLKQRGGTWRVEDRGDGETVGAEVIALIGDLEARATAVADSEPTMTAALNSAINELRKKLAHPSV
jgi:hypothetical protein